MKDLILKGYVNAMNTLANKRGSVIAEYGLIIALIVVVAIGAITTLGKNVNVQLQKLADAIPKN